MESAEVQTFRLSLLSKLSWDIRKMAVNFSLLQNYS